MVRKKVEVVEPVAENIKEIKEEPKEENIEEPPIQKHEAKKESKKGKIITCEHCGKAMLEKTFKYYHTLKCGPAASKAEPPNPEVVFDFTRKVEGRTSRYGNLFSKAV
jgi:hypothetical protein